MEESTSTVTTDTGADTHTDSAENQGTVDTTGAETQTTTAEESGSADTTTKETETVTEENKDKGAHQKTFSERMAEIEAKNEARLVEIEKKFLQKQESQTPDFAPPEVESRVKQNILTNNTRLREIEDEIRNSENGQIPEELAAEYEQRMGFVDEARQALRENQKKRIAWEEKSKSESQASEAFTTLNKSLDSAANMHIDQLKKDGKVTDEVISAGQRLFAQKLEADKTLAEEYMERAQKDGPVRATKWAIDYTMKLMEESATTARTKKETGKDTTIGAGTGEGGGTDFSKVKTYSDLLALPSDKINEFYKANPKRYEELKQRHFK